MRNHQHGYTLIELLIATALGLLIVLIATGLVVSSKSAQSTQNDAAALQDTARFALDNISRSVKQAGYVNLDQDDAPALDMAKMPASIMGIDGGSLKTTSHGIDSPSASKNASDILALRFFGSTVANTIINCAGSGVSVSTSKNELIKEPGWSIYYVANDVTDEPALYCKYTSKSNENNQTFTAQAIARGVESFQVLYRVSTNLNDLGEHAQFLNATQINALDSAIPEAELIQKTHWKKITEIKVAMLIRSADNARFDSSPTSYHLFGQDYSSRAGSSDKGTQINEADMPEPQRRRLRKIVGTTIQLRNAMS